MALEKTIVLLAVKFKIEGNLRFLSHAETVRIFQRACVRADMPLVYSKGFNPHPRMSLPLPRSVGVEADGDLLCLRIGSSGAYFDCEDFERRFSEELPEGFRLLSVSVVEGKKIFQPTAATYIFTVSREYLGDRMKAKIKSLLESDNLNIRRQVDAHGRFRNMDVRPFLKSIKLEDTCIVVECNITSAGSIRVDEVLGLLDLEVEQLASPIKRTNIQWWN